MGILISLVRRDVAVAQCRIRMSGIKATWGSMLTNTMNYYRPMFRSGSCKPLWHIMLATGVIMYSQNYIFNKGANVQAARKEQKIALEEYYERHGKTAHH